MTKHALVVDRKGLAKKLSNRPKGFILYELLQNCWDENVTRVRCEVKTTPGRPEVRIFVEDDCPEGFQDLTSIYTLFKDSKKAPDPTKRGRFELGEKLVAAVAHRMEVVTTKGTIIIEGDKRIKLRKKLQAGSCVLVDVRMTRAEFTEMMREVAMLIPPDGIETTINGDHLPRRTPEAVFETTLQTVFADAEGNLKPTSRKTQVRVYPVREGETAHIYEMGIPVVATGDQWHYDVCVAGPTKILTADLRYIPAGQVRPGDRLLGFDEEGERSGVSKRAIRKFRSSVVLSTSRVVRPCYRLTFEDGTEVICSADHQWLSLKGRTVKWIKAKNMVVPTKGRQGSLVVRPLDVWEKLDVDLLGKMPTGRKTAARLVKKDFLGAHEVIAIATSTRTFIAEGLASHNCQRVPVNWERNNVPPSYLKALRVEVLNALHHQLSKAEAKEGWVSAAIEDERIEAPALDKVLDHRYGKKRVINDLSDPEGTKMAMAAGYTVMHGGSESKGTWANIRKHGTALPAGKVTPSPKVYDPDGHPEDVLPDSEWTADMKRIAEFARELFQELDLGHRFSQLRVVIVKEPKVGWCANFGGNRLCLNYSKLGKKWFARRKIDVQVTELLLHEFCHHTVKDHLSDEMHKTATRLGAQLALLVYNNKSLFEG